MARRLDVWWAGERVGALTQDESGRLEFRYDESWLGRDGARPLSVSMPLTAEPYGDRLAHAFFGGLLPEQDKRDLVARILGISARNDFAMLDAIGGDCAGALSLLPPGREPSRRPDEVRYRPLSPDMLGRILERLPDRPLLRPLLSGDAEVRLSLAGAQDKLPVFVADGDTALPLGDTPSSHILKPAIPRFADTVRNEAFCLALARAAGLDAVEAEIRSVQGAEVLVVERYDRRSAPGRTLVRLHQEDFCQALGVPAELKYQNEGGPALAECFDLLRRVAARPAVDINKLLEAVFFNALIGNNDAHAKNFALLYRPGGLALAPLYDLVSTAVYDGLSPRMAMKIGGKYEFDALYPRHWDRFAGEAGLNAPRVRKKLLDLCRGLPAIAAALLNRFEAEGHGGAVVDGIVALVAQRGAQLLERSGPAR